MCEVFKVICFEKSLMYDCSGFKLFEHMRKNKYVFLKKCVELFLLGIWKNVTPTTCAVTSLSHQHICWYPTIYVMGALSYIIKL